MSIEDEAPGAMDVEPAPASIRGAGTEVCAVADPPPAARDGMDLDVAAAPDGHKVSFATREGDAKAAAEAPAGDLAGGLARAPGEAPGEAPAVAPGEASAEATDGASTEAAAAAPGEPSPAAPGGSPALPAPSNDASPPPAAPDEPPPARSARTASRRPSSFDPLPHLPSLPYRQARVLRGHVSAVCSVRFDGEGGRVLSASADGTVCLWRVSDGALLGRIRHARKRREHGAEVPGGVSDACWFPTADMVATGGDDGVVRLWRNAGPYGGDGGAGGRKARGGKAGTSKKAGAGAAGRDEKPQTDEEGGEKTEIERGPAGADAGAGEGVSLASGVDAGTGEGATPASGTSPEPAACGEATSRAGAADDVDGEGGAPSSDGGGKSAGEGGAPSSDGGGKSAGEGGAPSSDGGGNASAEEGGSVAPVSGGNASAEEGGDAGAHSDGAPTPGMASESASVAVKEEDEEEGDGAKSSPAQRPRKKSKRERERERKRERREADRLRRGRQKRRDQGGDGGAEGEGGGEGGGDGDRVGDEDADGEEDGEFAPSTPPLHSYALVGTLRAHTHAVTSLDASPLGSLLASASFDETVVVWSVVDCSPLRAIPAHSDPVMSVRFAPGDAARPVLVSASLDGVVRVWDALGGRCLASLLAPRQAPATWAAFSANGTLVVSSHVDVREAEEEEEGARGDGKENRERGEGAAGVAEQKGATKDGAGNGGGSAAPGTNGPASAGTVASPPADASASALAGALAPPPASGSAPSSTGALAPPPPKTSVVRAVPPSPPEAVVWHLPERRLVRACRIPASPAPLARGPEAARPSTADARFQTCRASALFRDRAGRMLALATGAEHALHAWDLNVPAAAADRGQRAWAAPEPKHVGVLRGRPEEPVEEATGKPGPRPDTRGADPAIGSKRGTEDARGGAASSEDGMDVSDAPESLPDDPGDARTGASALPSSAEGRNGALPAPSSAEGRNGALPAPSSAAPEEPWGHADVILGLDVTSDGVIATSAHDRDPTVRIWQPLDAAAETAAA